MAGPKSSQISLDVPKNIVEAEIHIKTTGGVNTFILDPWKMTSFYKRWTEDFTPKEGTKARLRKWENDRMQNRHPNSPWKFAYRPPAPLAHSSPVANSYMTPPMQVGIPTMGRGRHPYSRTPLPGWRNKKTAGSQWSSRNRHTPPSRNLRPRQILFNEDPSTAEETEQMEPEQEPACQETGEEPVHPPPQQDNEQPEPPADDQPITPDLDIACVICHTKGPINEACQTCFFQPNLVSTNKAELDSLEEELPDLISDEESITAAKTDDSMVTHTSFDYGPEEETKEYMDISLSAIEPTITMEKARAMHSDMTPADQQLPTPEKATEDLYTSDEETPLLPSQASLNPNPDNKEENSCSSSEYTTPPEYPQFTGDSTDQESNSQGTQADISASDSEEEELTFGGMALFGEKPYTWTPPRGKQLVAKMRTAKVNRSRRHEAFKATAKPQKRPDTPHPVARQSKRPDTPHPFGKEPKCAHRDHRFPVVLVERLSPSFVARMTGNALTPIAESSDDDDQLIE